MFTLRSLLLASASLAAVAAALPQGTLEDTTDSGSNEEFSSNDGTSGTASHPVEWIIDAATAVQSPDNPRNWTVTIQASFIADSSDGNDGDRLLLPHNATGSFLALGAGAVESAYQFVWTDVPGWKAEMYSTNATNEADFDMPKGTPERQQGLFFNFGPEGQEAATWLVPSIDAEQGWHTIPDGAAGAHDKVLYLDEPAHVSPDASVVYHDELYDRPPLYFDSNGVGVHDMDGKPFVPET